jgi:hypothetical protein
MADFLRIDIDLSIFIVFGQDKLSWNEDKKHQLAIHAIMISFYALLCPCPNCMRHEGGPVQVILAVDYLGK